MTGVQHISIREARSIQPPPNAHLNTVELAFRLQHFSLEVWRETFKANTFVKNKLSIKTVGFFEPPLLFHCLMPAQCIWTICVSRVLIKAALQEVWVSKIIQSLILFFFENVLLILGPLHFYVNFRTRLSTTGGERYLRFYSNCVESVGHLLLFNKIKASNP